jgi:hypothetical protein
MEYIKRVYIMNMRSDKKNTYHAEFKDGSKMKISKATYDKYLKALTK